MQIQTMLSLVYALLLLLSNLSLTIQVLGLEPAPAPDSGDGAGLDSIEFAPNSPPLEETSSITVRWCAVRDEFLGCRNYVDQLNQTGDFELKCVRKETVQECLDSIKSGEADLITLEPGLAYVAFINYSMKAIGNEVYCNHAESYEAVAVVNKKVCKGKGDISLMDFKGMRSCHGGYGTAMGWNYPINRLKMMVNFEDLNDSELVKEFFSSVCAPSEFKGMGVCSGCGNENGSCHSDSVYSGHMGAFRCLIEELGDVSFVKADTALLYSLEGPYNQTWSTKSISDFMYLCPQGGCREINGYPGTCSFGSIPANVIMASNSISSVKKSAVQQMIQNTTWTSALYTGQNEANHLLSSSAQGLAVVKKLTRTYLGTSASISQSIQELNKKKVLNSPSSGNTASDAPSSSKLCAKHRCVLAILSIMLLGIIFSTVST
ncbi:hypothetical protein Sjap_013890 [Stephania japonica]|uniref:Transferrin-like domain-containing protein n=1 Tax=Stephania japonica TaxID=461633 RepID=A0AAP0IYW4_9MAGN